MLRVEPGVHLRHARQRLTDGAGRVVVDGREQLQRPEHDVGQSGQAQVDGARNSRAASSTRSRQAAPRSRGKQAAAAPKAGGWVLAARDRDAPGPT